MTTCRLIYKSRVRNGEVLAYSTEAPQFPVENLQDDLLMLVWRSRYGTGTGNGRFVVTAGVNNKINFDEGGAELTATLTAATYTGASLATEVATQLTAAGGTYTCTYSESTGKFTIARAAGNFTIRWNTGTNKAVDASGLLGFSDAADDTGAATYDSDTVAIHTSESIDIDFGAAYEYDSIALLGHNLTSSAVITVKGADDSAITSNVVTDTLTYSANNIYEFIGAARTKRYCRLTITDPANPSMYVQVGHFVVGKYFQPNRNFGPYSEGELDETEIEYSPANAMFTVQERTALINREYAFKGLDGTAIAEVRLLLAECGVRKAFWICTDSAAANANSAWVKLKETALPNLEQFGYWNWEMPVEQVL